MRSFRSFFSTVLRKARADPEALVAVLQGLWPHLTGEEISAHSRPVSLRRSTLVVEVASTRWTGELAGLEQMLVEKINRFWDDKLIDRIEFQRRLSQ